MANKIILELHQVDDALALDSSDIYQFIDENNPDDAELALYIDKYCQYLNNQVSYWKSDLRCDDTENIRLEGWIARYNTAAKYTVVETKACVEIDTGKRVIVLNRPFLL